MAKHPKPALKIAVIGDAGTDRWFCGSQRGNPEGDWPVVERLDGPFESAGMATAVAAMCEALGAEVRLVARTQQPFTHSIKTRFVTAGIPEQIVFRADWDPPPLCVEQRRLILTTAVEAAQWADAVAISDYGKGVVTAELVRDVIRAARGPVLVDPARGRDWTIYRECWAIKAPRACFEAQPLSVRKLFPRRIVTDGARGLEWQEGDHGGYVAAYTHGMPCDAIGAGDQVLAVLAVEAAAGSPLSVIAELAVIAAGILCTRRGAAPTHRYEIAGVLADRESTAPDDQVVR